MNNLHPICLLLCLLGYVYTANAQQTQTVDLESMAMPNSPAFILLDVAPSSIAKPTTAKAFTTSVLNSVNQNNGFPENYAIEFTPYWFTKHENLSAKKFWGLNGEKQMPFSKIKFLSISLATVRTTEVGDTSSIDINNVSVGVKTTLFQVKSGKVVKGLNRASVNALEFMSNAADGPDIAPADIAAALKNSKEYNGYIQQIKDLQTANPLFSIDFAAASAWSFIKSDFNSISLSRAGAWLTLAGSGNINKDTTQFDNYFNIYAVAKVFLDNNLDLTDLTRDESAIFDAGGKLEFEFGNLDISGEFLYRYDITLNEEDFRASGLLSYRVSDNILITGAFGKNYGDSNNLISQIGIQWGVNTKNDEISLE